MARIAALTDVAILVGAGVLMVGGFSAAAWMLDGQTVLQWMAPLLQALLLCLLAWTLLRRRGVSWRSIGLERPVSLRRVAALVVSGYLAMGLLAIGLNFVLLRPLGLGQPALGAFAELVGSPWTYAYWLFLAWTTAAIGEELLFRGFLRDRLEVVFGGGRWSAPAAVAGQAVLFGVAHSYQGLAGVILTGMVGVVLGVVYLAGRRNLAACIVLHGLIDTISLTAVFLGVMPEQMMA